MGVPMFRHYSSGVADQGGPRWYEAIFVGYDEDRVGWYVRDLKGIFHFSRDIIFNELVSGCLSSSRSLPAPSSDSPSLPPPILSSHPTRLRSGTEAGQVFADSIAARDARRLARTTMVAEGATVGGDADPPPLSLAVMLDLHSLNVCASFPNPVLTWSLATKAHQTLLDYCLLTHVDPSQHLHAPRVYDLAKPPDSYHEACSRPDA